MLKIIIADRNRLLREMLNRAIYAANPNSIVRIVNSLDDLKQSVEKLEPDWVIFSFPGKESTLPSEVFELMNDHPEIGLIRVSPDGSQVRASWLEPREIILDGINLNDFIQFLNTKSKIGEIEEAN